MSTDLPIYNSTRLRQYAGNKVYENGTLSMIILPNGYIKNNAYYFYLRDHLGNNSKVVNATGAVQQGTYYHPFGKPLGNESWNLSLQPYKYGNKEEETMLGLNLFDFDARWLDETAPSFLTPDPLAEKYYSVSPYAYCGNNPIRYTDPTGMWVADENGNLVAEKGDNAWTLAKYQGIKPQEAIAQLKGQGYSINDKGILNLKIGDKITLDNVYTQSLDDAKAGKVTVLTDAQMDKLTTKQYYSLMENTSDKYNCWGSAITGSQGKEIKAGVGIGQGATFDNSLSTSYKDANSSYKFGETIVRFANDGGVTHGAVYYGTSKNGDIYVYTKNGWLAYPKFMKLDDLMKSIPSYGSPTGIRSTESGFYNKK